VEQRSIADYLLIAHVVSFANTDRLARGPSEARRRYLDFLGAQIDPRYRPSLRAYERALRARNALLKSPHPRRRFCERSCALRRERNSSAANRGRSASG